MSENDNFRDNPKNFLAIPTAALELFQKLDALRSVGVRAEQYVRLRDETLEAHLVVEFLVRMNHVELRDIVAFYIGKARIRRNLP